MSATTIVPPGMPVFDQIRLGVAGFLARYSGPTRVSYAGDLRQFLAWCAQVNLAVFEASQAISSCGPARWKNGAGPGDHRPPAVDGGGVLPYLRARRLVEHSPAEHVRRPKMLTESATLGLDRMELAALSRRRPPAGSWTTPWPACSACSACAWRRPARSTSRTSPPSAAIDRHRGRQGIQAGRHPSPAPGGARRRCGRRRSESRDRCC